MQNTYFTDKFMTLSRDRKVEEISTMLLRVLYDANEDTDANIAIVDNLLELRSTLAQKEMA